MNMIIKNKLENIVLPIFLMSILLIASCSNDKKAYLEQLESRWQTLKAQEAKYGIEKVSVVEYQDFLKDFPENNKYGNQYATKAKEYIGKIKVIQDSILNAEIIKLKNDSLKQLRFDFYSAAIENDYFNHDCFDGEPSTEQNKIQIYGNTFSEYYCYIDGIAYRFPNLFGCAKTFARKNNISIKNKDEYAGLEAMAGVPVFSHSPKDTNYEFSYINPEIVNWAHNTLIPIPQNKFYNYSYQKIYNKVFRSTMRHHAVAHYYLHNVIKGQQVKAMFNEELLKENSYAPGAFISNQFSEFKVKASMINPDVEDDYEMYLQDVLGFWLRRMIDGSADELWKGLEKVLSLYDHEWKKRMLCKPERYLKLINWIPEEVLSSNKERSFTIKKDSLYMISESKTLWNKPDLLSRRKYDIWSYQIIRVDSLGESFTHNGEKLQWIKIDKKFNNYIDSTTEGWIVDAFIDRQVFNCSEIENCSLIVEFDTTSTKPKVNFKLFNPTEFPISINHPTFVFKFKYNNKQRNRSLSYNNMKHFPAKKETLVATLDVRRKNISSNKYEYTFRDNFQDKSAKFKISRDESWSLKTTLRFRVNSKDYELTDTTLSLW